ncbi:TIGR01777 family oxidoreductase [Bacillus methanolicus]|uniref:Epimerase family protein YfhF n=1 Tax=Bacillus methanolicus (strain MGA3 / ATCC 53907) TaxID=796606 RepID=I3E2N7_BACMM|nr:TIGR01777 family oxidoreductase [Bacillus methanolicus]AIE59139.1 Epimerase family protein YfhF [Bacillus methanolicus MGA3]EIJ80758.1 NAD dependent epimerase/dehydratase family protein [Bacillus methanolicus MGA3]
MKITITGGTGFVGKALAADLAKKGHEIIVLTRNADRINNNNNCRFIKWLSEGDNPQKIVEGTDIIINLAGESINNGRWTAKQKMKIKNSRMHVTESILKIISQLNKKPTALINASAVGIYGTSNLKTFTEDSKETGNDFLAETVHAWENTAMKADSDFGIRTVLCRFGIILDKYDGALPRMALPYQLFAGGTVGSGDQWVSWVHLKDVIRGIQFCIENERLSGPVNFTAPYPVTMKEFGKTLGSVLHRPHWLPVPEIALKLILGEMSILVLEGQKVLPAKLEENGFTFLFPDLKSALKDIYQ